MIAPTGVYTLNGFQSQTRSQSPGDPKDATSANNSVQVSIADAKPIPWLLILNIITQVPQLCFNRRREANPLATNDTRNCSMISSRFQSQTRSQSPGDL